VKPPRYAVNHYLCPVGVSLETFTGVVAAAGFDGIGLTQAALDEMPLPSLMALLRDRGLGVSSVNTAGFFLSSDGRQSERNERFLRAAVELQAPALNVIVGAAGPSLPLAEARRLAEAGLTSFARRAQDAGVQLVIEPLWMANVFTKSCFQSIAQLRDIFARIPGLKLNLDYYHLWCDPDLGKVLRGEDLPIGLLQLCDVTWPESPNQAARAPLGEGKLSVLAELAAAGHVNGEYCVELELFIDQLPGRNYTDLIQAAARQLFL